MKKKVMRFALLLVLPVAAAFVFSAYTGGGDPPLCPEETPMDYSIILPNPEDCSTFYVCSNGVAILMKCPDGLLFNRDLGVCDWPWEAVDCDAAVIQGYMTQRQVQCEYYGQVYVPGMGYVYGTLSYSVTENICTRGYEYCKVEAEANPCGQGRLVDP